MYVRYYVNNTKCNSIICLAIGNRIYVKILNRILFITYQVPLPSISLGCFSSVSVNLCTYAFRCIARSLHASSTLLNCKCSSYNYYYNLLFISTHFKSSKVNMIPKWDFNLYKRDDTLYRVTNFVHWCRSWTVFLHTIKTQIRCCRVGKPCQPVDEVIFRTSSRTSIILPKSCANNNWVLNRFCKVFCFTRGSILIWW